MIDEPKTLMSDSLKDSVENEQQFDVTTIATAAFVTNSMSFLSVVREMYIKKNSLKFVVSCRVDDAYELLSSIQNDDNQFLGVKIDHLKKSYDYELNSYDLKNIRIFSINNDDQTCECNIKFVTRLKSTL